VSLDGQTAGQVISQSGIPALAWFFLVKRPLSHSIEAHKS